MKNIRRLLCALPAVLIMGAVFSWPLPRYFTVGIASSSANVEKDNVRAMIPGDHLQFLYHMWLAQDTLAGKTPLFHNLYEFNTGDDAGRREVRPYYLPFSLFFTAGSLMGGRACGWNLAIVISLLITFWFSWMLARRYHPDEWVAAMLALIPLALPYAWITLLGGSPTGFAMMWVPILLYGIDRWIADKSAAGAALAGAAIFFAEWGDTHVFFFNVLISPFWVVFAYLYHYGFRRPRRSDWAGWLRSSAFLVPFIVLAALTALGVRHGLQSTAIASGRSEHEIRLFSHGLDSLVGWRGSADGGKIYVGYYGLALLAGAFMWSLVQMFRRRTSARGWCLLLLLVGIAAVFLLATGVENPLGPRAWRALIRLVPPYGMIRQPDKIFCILPALLLVTGALALNGAWTGQRKWPVRLVCIGLLLPLLFDYQARLNPTVCLLDNHQGAYAAVAADARASGWEPRALVIPLWPGDSHYSSLYQYYVSLYRIRMVNGYRPTARRDYLEKIFEPFQPVNSGYPNDAQLDELRARGITYLLLHEDVFPEKVSSFPVDATLVNLLQHPRLKLLARDGPVWSFVIRRQPVEVAPAQAALTVPVLFPVRFWAWAQSARDPESVHPADDAIGGCFVRAVGPMAEPMISRRIRTAGPMPMEWHVRLRGKGAFDLVMNAGNETFTASREVSAEDWTWVRISVPGARLNAEQTAGLQVREGALDLDVILLTHAGWVPPAKGTTLKIPAVAFFRAGYTLDDFSGIAFRRGHDPDGLIFYSRHLYLEPGVYHVSMEYETAAAPGTLIGALVMRPGRRNAPDQRMMVLAGAPARMEYVQPDNRFFYFGFDYARSADLVIRSVSFERRPPASHRDAEGCGL